MKYRGVSALVFAAAIIACATVPSAYAQTAKPGGKLVDIVIQTFGGAPLAQAVEIVDRPSI